MSNIALVCTSAWRYATKDLVAARIRTNLS